MYLIYFIVYTHQCSFCRKTLEEFPGTTDLGSYILLHHKFAYNWEHWNDASRCCWNLGLVSCMMLMGVSVVPCFCPFCSVPQALLGQLIFGDSLVALWWVGVSLTLSGLLVLQRSSSTNTHSGTPNKDEWDDVTWRDARRDEQRRLWEI